MLLRAIRDALGGWKPRPAARPAGEPLALFRAAEAALLAGDRETARERCRRLREAAPDFLEVDGLQAMIRFSGEFYLEVMARIQQAVRPRTYVEIGVAEGKSLRKIAPPTIAIGIDPEPLITAPLGPNHKVFAETSDGFFASHDLRAELGGLPLDLGFIDGMHHFEFALRDFANLERYATRDSTLLIHDVYPLDRVTAERDRMRLFWSGDIWRLILLLKKYRPDLALQVIATPPTGLAVVRNLDPGSTLLLERHDALVREFLALDYEVLEEDMPGMLNLFPNDWAMIRSLLGTAAAG